MEARQWKKEVKKKKIKQGNLTLWLVSSQGKLVAHSFAQPQQIEESDGMGRLCDRRTNRRTNSVETPLSACASGSKVAEGVKKKHYYRICQSHFVLRRRSFTSPLLVRGEGQRAWSLEGAGFGNGTASSPFWPWCPIWIPRGCHPAPTIKLGPAQSRLSDLAIGRHLDPSSVSHADAPCGKEATQVLEGAQAGCHRGAPIP